MGLTFMLYVILFTVGALALFYVTWFAFLSVMALKAARDAGKLTPLNFELAAPGAYVAVGLDFLTNIVASVLFLQLPRWWLLTIRCDWNMTYAGTPADDSWLTRALPWLGPWRAHLAWTICTHVLDPFQVGGHCHKIGEQ